MFRFNLEFLLRFRRQKEEGAMNELAKTVREANQIENELTTARNRAREIAAQVSEMSGAELSAPVYVMFKEYQDQLRKNVETGEFKMSKAEEKVEKKRLELVEKSVERKIIEEFKDRKKKAYLEKIGKLEQKNLDELASLARARREREEIGRASCRERV